MLDRQLLKITFDLNQAALALNYPRPKFSLDPLFYKKAYKDIKRFMLKNGFKWTQYSVYESIDKLSYAQTIKLMTDMASQMPWLPACINEITATEIISKRYNFTKYLRNMQENTQEIIKDNPFLLAANEDQPTPSAEAEDKESNRKRSLQEIINSADARRAQVFETKQSLPHRENDLAER